MITCELSAMNGGNINPNGTDKTQIDLIGREGDQAELSLGARAAVAGINGKVVRWMRALPMYGFEQVGKHDESGNKTRYVYSEQKRSGRFSTPTPTGRVYIVFSPRNGYLRVEECDPSTAASANYGLGDPYRVITYRFDPKVFAAKDEVRDLTRLLSPGVISYSEPDNKTEAELGFNPPKKSVEPVEYITTDNGLVSVGSAEEQQELLTQAERVADLLISGNLMLLTRI